MEKCLRIKKIKLKHLVYKEENVKYFKIFIANLSLSLYIYNKCIYIYIKMFSFLFSLFNYTRSAKKNTYMKATLVTHSQHKWKKAKPLC